MKKSVMREELRALVEQGLHVVKSKEDPEQVVVFVTGFYLTSRDNFVSRISVVHNKAQKRFEVTVAETLLLNDVEVHRFIGLMKRAETCVNRLNRLLDRHSARFFESLPIQN